MPQRLASAISRLHDQGVDVARTLTDAHAVGLGVDLAVAAAADAPAPPEPHRGQPPSPPRPCPLWGPRLCECARSGQAAPARTGRWRGRGGCCAA
ncbi:hypothetical protein V6574_34895 [Streptomyces sp. SM1P]